MAWRSPRGAATTQQLYGRSVSSIRWPRSAAIPALVHPALAGRVALAAQDAPRLPGRGPRDERREHAVGHQAQGLQAPPRGGSRRRARPGGTKPRPGDRAIRRGLLDRRLHGAAGECPHERRYRRRVVEPRLHVQLAHLDRAEPGLQTHVPTRSSSVRVVGPAAGDHRADRLQILVEGTQRRRHAAAGYLARRPSARWRARVCAEPERRARSQAFEQRQRLTQPRERRTRGVGSGIPTCT